MKNRLSSASKLRSAVFLLVLPLLLIFFPVLLSVLGTLRLPRTLRRLYYLRHHASATHMTMVFYSSVGKWRHFVEHLEGTNILDIRHLPNDLQAHLWGLSIRELEQVQAGHDIIVLRTDLMRLFMSRPPSRIFNTSEEAVAHFLGGGH
jgi:hypothetical protein